MQEPYFGPILISPRVTLRIDGIGIGPGISRAICLPNLVAFCRCSSLGIVYTAGRGRMLGSMVEEIKLISRFIEVTFP